ncbi:MAG: excinuclease ABC subunit UvrA [Bacteroidales bacterium]|jgi:excinuclease ABC subunit A|nr:excinuclease ABC subunit UvrA [Bacteroidales bacterium]
MKKKKNIIIKGARVNNLKNINVEIPRNKFVVITGLSGSGKSSLAFDTLYAEGQRRYVESLSSYARQFLGKMSKPETDFIKGIPPAIAIEQKVNTRNPRSTVGTSTEIYDYLRLLYARVGKTYSPVSGQLVQKHQVSDVVDCMLRYPDGIRFSVLTKPHVHEDRDFHEQLDMLQKEGFSRLDMNGEILRIEDVLAQQTISQEDVLLLIDRMTVGREKDVLSRMADSVQTAFYEGMGECILKFYSENGTEIHHFTNRFEADGIVFEEPNDLMFNFNSPSGACHRCEGFGKVIGIDEELVVPDKNRSVYDDAVVCWRGDKMGEWKHELVQNAERAEFPIHTPYYQLTKEQRDMLWNGTPYFQGIRDFFKFLEENHHKIQYRMMSARYRGKTNCPTCSGGRLKPQAQHVKVDGKAISELTLLSISDILLFFKNLTLPKQDAQIAARLLLEINNRLRFLCDVGLGYLTLDRLSSTLSGGESQRINLATSLGSSLVGSLYILDEPSIGLHSRDTGRLINVLLQLRDLGNTVVVVEHDEEIIRAADYIIDIGPDAGSLGGEVVYEGEIAPILANEIDGIKSEHKSYTVDYLIGRENIPVPAMRRKWSNYLQVNGVCENNLKAISVRFPLNVMTVVTGVSGSGKSSLVQQALYSGLKKRCDSTRENDDFSTLSGDLHLIKSVEFIDQNPIGRSTRSNPVTYIKAYDEIRKLFSDQPLAKQMGYTPSHFSFNIEGGRCEECKGEGLILVEMQFMADIRLTCESCHGHRFKRDILEVEYQNRNIYDVLEMTVNDAISFFQNGKTAVEKNIVKRLMSLQRVGLGYIKLGQTSSTLSGGENQRVKLASFLGTERQSPVFFIFDEPTTGLHFHDIKTLLKAFDELIARGHTLLIVEHNMDVIKCADHIIDMGPEGGENGGYLVCTGTPEEVAACSKSHTGRFLKEKLEAASFQL